MKNNISTNVNRINSPYLIQGFLNSSIIYDSFYSLDNFAPIYDGNGKMHIVGSGSYGQVYLALHFLNKKYYAIKHMDKKKLFSQLHSLESIQKEIDIQSRIDHPNIVKLLYVKETHLSYDLVMEYASNGNLFHYIRKYKGLNENKTFSLFIQVVNAINFMHSNDLIHRDIKPENILIFENNIIKLCDFGWCVKLEGHQRGTFCGTTEYMSPELVNHQVYGKEIDVWSLGILLYEMIHGYSPFRPNKPKFNEKDVMENIKNHNLIFGKTVSDECKRLIYHLLDPDINKRYTVEDIYNSDFVKKYEKLHYDYPNNSLIQLYNGKINKSSEQNINNAIINNINDENINFNNINNIINSNSEINKNKSINNNITYINNYQISEPRNEYNNIYTNNNQKMKNIENDNIKKEVLFDYNHNGYFYSQNMNNDYSNNIYLCINNDNSRKNNISNNDINIANSELNNIFNNNNNNNKIKEEENIKNYYLENEEKHPQDKRKNRNEIMDNNSFLRLYEENNKNNSIGISNYSNINYSKETDNNNIWNNPINDNNLSQLNNISNIQYIKINQNEKKIENYQNTKNNDNNSINYNYYYNFNNYNNNYTNNYYNNNYHQISPNQIQISNYNINSVNSNMNNSNIKIILDRSKTASTIATSSNKIKKENKLIKQKRISEFEIGEEKYNLSEKEQNDNEQSAIKININNEQQKINNRKYLSRSDYSIFNKNKNKEEKGKNIFIKKLDIGEIKIENSNQNINNSERLNEEKNDISSVENVEQYLLKNKLNKNNKEKIYKMNINSSEPNINQKRFNNKKSIKISNTNSIEKKNIKRRLLSEKNTNENIKDKEENKILINKINQEKKEYTNNLRYKIINKENNPIEKNDLKRKEDNYIGDLLCSLFNIFDSKSDKKNEINIMKKENKYSNNTHKSLNSKSNNINNIHFNKNRSFIKMDKSNKSLNTNSSFIKINNKRSKVISLGLSQIESNCEINNNKKIKKISIINTQPNLDNKENNKNIINYNNVLKHHVSSNNINVNKYQKLKSKENKIIEIPINSNSINITHKNNKKLDDYNNLNNSKIITPKKRNIFNRIHPFILLRDFKKELTNYSQHNSKFNN
jgi:serine/threonine protein kinase